MKLRTAMAAAVIGAGSLLQMAHAGFALTTSGESIAGASVTYDSNKDGVAEKSTSVGFGTIRAITDGKDVTTGQQLVPAFNIKTVCLDVGITLASTEYMLVNPAGLDGINPDWGNPVTSEQAAKALNAAAYLVQASGIKTAANQTAENFQALQLAVWETLYDYDAAYNNAATSFDNGRFTVQSMWSVSGNPNAKAKTYIQNVINAKNSALGVPEMKFQVLRPKNDNSQELFFDFGSITVVPEPTTYLAGALLLVPFGVSTLRLLRRKPAVEA